MMTEPTLTTHDPAGTSGSVRTGFAVFAMIAALVLGTAAMAFASGGGIGTGGDGEKSGSDRYQREWDSFSQKDKRWARRTSQCESTNDANIHDRSGTYHGAFQFSLSTWKTSPMSPGGDPHKYRWKTQAVVAVKLKHRDGAGHWPVCG